MPPAVLLLGGQHKFTCQVPSLHHALLPPPATSAPARGFKQKSIKVSLSPHPPKSQNLIFSFTASWEKNKSRQKEILQSDHFHFTRCHLQCIVQHSALCFHKCSFNVPDGHIKCSIPNNACRLSESERLLNLRQIN